MRKIYLDYWILTWYFCRGRKLNLNLESAIQEAMMELDKNVDQSVIEETGSVPRPAINPKRRKTKAWKHHRTSQRLNYTPLLFMH